MTELGTSVTAGLGALCNGMLPWLAMFSLRTHDFLVKSPEIKFTVERDEESGWFTASWDASDHGGGITTQGKDLSELEKNVREAVECHFEDGGMPRQIRLRFLNDAVLATL